MFRQQNINKLDMLNSLKNVERDILKVDPLDPFKTTEERINDLAHDVPDYQKLGVKPNYNEILAYVGRKNFDNTPVEPTTSSVMKIMNFDNGSMGDYSLTRNENHEQQWLQKNTQNEMEKLDMDFYFNRQQHSIPRIEGM